MAESMYSKFKKYILFQEDFIFMTSLYFIFNEKNEVKRKKDNEIGFFMTYKKFKEYLLKLKKDASNSCGVVCPSIENCKGHAVLKLMQDYDDFLFDSVERQGEFYKEVIFVKEKSDDDLMFGYTIHPIGRVDLGWKSWSQRMSYLKI